MCEKMCFVSGTLSSWWTVSSICTASRSSTRTSSQETSLSHLTTSSKSPTSESQRYYTDKCYVAWPHPQNHRPRSRRGITLTNVTLLDHILKITDLGVAEVLHWQMLHGLTTSSKSPTSESQRYGQIRNCQSWSFIAVILIQ